MLCLAIQPRYLKLREFQPSRIASTDHIGRTLASNRNLVNSRERDKRIIA